MTAFVLPENLVDSVRSVRLHDYATTILLLERCRPGDLLGEALPESDQDQIVARSPVEPFRIRLVPH
jgi:hypothetical protein